MPAATTTSTVGRDLRAARKQAGLTRAQLASLAGCSLAALGNIEQGAVPKRSRVLLAALHAIERHTSTTSEAPAGNQGFAKTAAGPAGDARSG